MFDFMKTIKSWKAVLGFLGAMVLGRAIINSLKTVLGFIGTIEQGFNLGKFIPIKL